MKILITGGAGFVGTNTAKFMLKRGHEVVLLDNGSRKGWEYNLEDLKKVGSFEFVRIDVRDFDSLAGFARKHRDASLVIHLAAQVAVTTSVTDPRQDFEINALGTLNVLEALRLAQFQGLLVYSSTNKVYGDMQDLQVVESNGQYAYQNVPKGVNEERPLDFHSPYGCSKGAADQYVRDYSRIYGIKTAVFRQSCIYGPHQYGVEDQGWVAWFTIAAVTQQPITIYGDGKQVRDVLYAQDLAEAFLQAHENKETVRGQIYNIGGGPSTVLSLHRLLGALEENLGRKIPVQYSNWRPGDQKIFVADVSKAERDFGWRPSTPISDGLNSLISWVSENRTRFQK
ncbi:NAD-dependent epimerase/dehydratase family protein [Bdellovibrionota bacterium FG-2]